VTEVYLSVWKRGLKDTDLKSLLSLEKLYTIEFSHGIILGHLPGGSALIDRELSFDGVVPLLQKFGNYLKKILMGGFIVVHIPAIAEYCPNLESLTLDNCKTNQSTEPKEKCPGYKNYKSL
jgi:hypothetical protein